MKRFSKVAISAAAAALVLAMPFAANAEKVVTAAVNSTFTTMDPYDANDTLSQAVAKSFYEGLFEFNQKNERVPCLATDFTASQDGLTYTINLRKGVKFSDGTPFNGEAVKINLERAANPDNHLKRYNLYGNIKNVEAVNDYQVKVHLKEPFSAFINQLTHPSGVMISPAALKKYGKDIGRHPVGTGPFMLQDWQQTDGIVAVKNPNYWQKGLPKIDKLVWRNVPENATRANMLLTGEAQFTNAVPFEQAAVLKKDSKLDVVASPSVILRYVTLNVLQKPFDNLKVRQALNYAINKEALAKVAFNGYAFPDEGVVPQGIAYALKQNPWPYDPKKARELLKEAGYPNGFESTLWSAYNHTTAQKVIQFLQQQLAQVGVKVSVRALEAGQRVQLVESAPDPKTAPVRMYYVGWSSSTGEADWAIRPLLGTVSMPPKGFNVANYSNKVVDDGLIEALNTVDENKKKEIYAKVQQQIWDDAPWIFLVTEKNLYAKAKKVSDFYVIPDGNMFFRNVDIK